MQSLLFALIDHFLVPPPEPAKVRWLGQWDYAHRGLHGAGFPENAKSAFAAAIARGLGIECDVQRSSDGLAIVFHDAALDRLTSETGLIARHSADQLGRIALSGSTDTIPTLRQVLDQVDGKVGLLIEIKSDGERRVNALSLAVRRQLEGYRGAHAVMSFDPRVVRWFANNSAHTVRGLVVTEEGAKSVFGRLKRRLAFWHARPDFLAYDIRDLPSRFAAGQRRRGLPVLTWTVRSADHRERAQAHADAPIAEGAGIV
jgi:glycerophosphoryl diester phosphodiesterase